ncbi:Brix-domain-containing protein [Neoconidiobolus thromboides FSU 785]|nr:Brix-domain-containing protein [Neoconidiobolus thromboides FSU 785]
MKFTGGEIKNKIARRELLSQFRQESNKKKRELKRIRRKEELANPELKEKRLAENVPQTLESKREYDETMVEEDDEDEIDEFANYFSKNLEPKVLITTSKSPSRTMYTFTDELCDVFPNSTFVKRGIQFEINHIVEFSKKRDYTDVIIVNEDKKMPTSLTLIHLPDGPTAHFRLSSVIMSKQIHNHGRSTSHNPELILNNFNTRLGHTIGRMFQSLFPQVPEFEGRQTATFHNQRDFIFFRRHRYEFKSGEKVNLQEIGPRFTLKLKWLQRGLFDSEKGEFIWKFNADMETSRKRFFL